MKISPQLPILAVIVAGAFSTGRAAILADYDFTGSSLASVDSNAQSVAGAFAKASVFSESGFSDGDGSFLFVTSQRTPMSEELAISTNAYLSFTVTAEAGSSLNLTSLTFGTAWYTTTAASSGVTNFVIRSSIDNYSANLAVYSDSPGQGNTSTPTFTGREIDLSGSSFQSISGVTFRIYIWDVLTGGTRHAAVDDVILNGTAISSVPEPSSVALAAGLVIGAFATLRRRRSSGN